MSVAPNSYTSADLASAVSPFVDPSQDGTWLLAVSEVAATAPPENGGDVSPVGRQLPSAGVVRREELADLRLRRPSFAGPVRPSAAEDVPAKLPYGPFAVVRLAVRRRDAIGPDRPSRPAHTVRLKGPT